MLTRLKEEASNFVWDTIRDDETWIYYYEFKTKQQSTVWFYQDEPKQTKVAREQSASKRMIASFFNKTGHVTTFLWRTVVPLVANDILRRFYAPRPFLLLRCVPILYYCDAFVTNFTAAKFRVLYRNTL
ncbi:hypothetical protein EVAR_55877_1 [Eumeta japonica]|uniref:Mariner Mos1 transposase n=1 Tax=Eumeta variegata TaxID=151549 RepID=A0A4C1YKM7_EUMVA|nr:hypothetical protein EVAR_55877_1 [Eumeta japonica]